MNSKRTSFEPNGLTISYRGLGTINIKELRDAVLEDIAALIEGYNIQYVKNARLRLEVTNEYGEEVKLQKPTGGTLTFLDTHHYRPACKDYNL